MSDLHANCQLPQEQVLALLGTSSSNPAAALHTPSAQLLTRLVRGLKHSLSLASNPLLCPPPAVGGGGLEPPLTGEP